MIHASTKRLRHGCRQRTNPPEPNRVAGAQSELEQLAMTSCATKAEILRKAIVLYELAYRASLKD
jgi:hypothetical protein